MPKKEAKMRSRQLRAYEPYTAAAEPETSQADNGYSGLTKAELQDELSSRDLPTSGNKDELIARLEENDAE